ncbi:hypothetical protein FKG94_00295 [Exilibacterium tricleocarpae]|uniref:Uncharacterized protein n=1 Tax=Exilibacterium tricleocarpae TaxID=2591008 RepID=A0A545U990_9GAMM|nr:hypothetical protein [Exilibacterium tricleocarpae]TQV86034.1 hypothetical protein FKG94_00295 [Exilibacterium tricleocarpae]
MSFQEVESTIVRIFLEAINNEFFRGDSIEDSFWLNHYDGLSINQRSYLWWVRILRYEHMVHGLFDQESLEREVLFLHRAISEKDKESDKIFKCLVDNLKRTPLQNIEISQFIEAKLQAL